MLKRVVLIVAVALLAGAVIWFLLRRPAVENGFRQSAAIRAVPEDAVLILESRSVPDLLKAIVQSEPLFPSLSSFGPATAHLAALRSIDSLISHNSDIRQQYARNPAVVSIHQTGKNQYQFLIILEMKGFASASSADRLFEALCGNRGQWSQRTYNGHDIHRVTFGVDALIPGLSLATTHNFLIISPSPILLENAVRQPDQPEGLHSGTAFTRLSKTTGKNALANVYVNLRALPAWMSQWLNPALKKKVEAYSRYGDWASLDLTVRNDAVWFNGFALPGDTINTWLNLFRNQEPGKLVADQYFPSTTAAYFSVGIDEPGQYLRLLSDYLGGNEPGRRRQMLINQAGTSNRESVVETWSNTGFREVAIGYVCGVEDESFKPLAMVGVKNGAAVTDQLITPRETGNRGRRGAKTAPARKLRAGDDKEYTIYPMPYEGLPEILGGSLFTTVRGRYFTTVGNQLFLADDMQLLEDVLHKYSINKTLAHDASYRSLAPLVTTRSNATFFVFPYRAKPLLKAILNATSLEALLADESLLKKTGAIGLQFNSGSGMALHNCFASFAEIDYSKPQTLWEARLDAKVSGRPFIVTNHLTRDKEILVQDEKNTLYLLNSSGRILWKKEIGEPINSEIQQIDLMRNGRLQFLFSTSKAIHIIDRNGEWLPKFPVRLPRPATNGISLIDFDGNRDYRLLIACDDNIVHAFDKNGNPVKGWKFEVAAGPIRQPVQHFNIRNKDFVVCTDPVRVHILDRKGTVKILPKKDFAVSPNNPVVFDPSASEQNSRFLVTDVAGTVMAIYLDGRVEETRLGEFSPEHYFTVADINRDGLTDFVFVDKNRVEVFNHAGDRIIQRKLDSSPNTPPVVLTPDGKNLQVGLTLSDRQEILLLNPDGSLCDGFPLRGQSAFTIGVLDKNTHYKNLLVGSDDSYLFNYAIQ